MSMQTEPEIKRPYEDWLANSYPMLDARCFNERCTTDGTDATARELLREQLGTLLLDAETPNAFGSKAREFIGYLVQTHAVLIADSERQYVLDAAVATVNVLSERPELRFDFVSCVTGILQSHTAVSELRSEMLDILARSFRPDAENGLSYREYAGELLNALSFAMANDIWSNDPVYVKRLLTLIVKHPHPATDAVLHALVDEVALNEDAVIALRAALEKIEDRVEQQWELSPTDLIATNEERALRLRAVTELDFTEAQDTRQYVFNQCKGANLTESEDPLVVAMQALLQPSTNISRAVAWSLARVGNFPDSSSPSALDRACTVLINWANDKSAEDAASADRSLAALQARSASLDELVQQSYSRLSHLDSFRQILKRAPKRNHSASS